MPNYVTAFTETIHEMLVDACIELFQQSGITIKRGSRPVSGAEICSTISGTGEGITLRAVIQPDKEILLSGHPCNKADISQEEAEDWCRELNNQLMGRLKTKLLERSCIINLGLPALIARDDILPTQPSKVTVLKQRFETEFGDLELTNLVDLDSEFVLPDMNSSAGNEVMHEGDVLLF